jgi:hypothetical protein
VAADERRLGDSFFFNLGELVGVAGLLKAVLAMQKLELAQLAPLRAGQANTGLVSWSGRAFALQETG